MLIIYTSKFRFVVPVLPFYHISESVEIGSFPG